MELEYNRNMYMTHSQMFQKVEYGLKSDAL